MKAWTVTYSRRYTDNGQIETGIKFAPTTYREARKEFAWLKQHYMFHGYKMTRFSSTEYGFANKYVTEVMELVRDDITNYAI